jgi:tetratricopeptide (TPR) repeat protein
VSSETEKKWSGVRFSAGWSSAPRPAAALPPAARARADLDLAHRLWREGNPEPAFAAARRAALTDPANAEAHALLGALALVLDRDAEAVQHLAAAAERCAVGGAEWRHVVSLRAHTLSRMLRWAEAERGVTAVAAQGPSAPVVEARLGSTLSKINCGDRAVPHLRRAVAAEPGRADFHAQFGDALTYAGELAEATREYEAALGLDPHYGAAHYALAQLRRWTAEDNHVERLRAVHRDPALDEAERGKVGYALFKELDDLGQPEEAWPFLAESTAIAWRADPTWNAAEEADRASIMIDAFAGTAPKTRTATAPAGPRPILVIGLPRSGTTLVERVLGAHSAVRPLGETPLLGRLYHEAITDRPGEADWLALADAYRAETAFLAGDARFVIDKMPDNFWYVGPFKRAYPDGLVVLVRRAPMDSLFGGHRLSLNYGWTRRQQDLAAHYLNYRRLTDHWRRWLDGDLVEVEYEALASDPEPQIRALLSGCGLPFEDACLRPHETAGPVSTASSSQVRRPIGRDRIGGWRRYEDRLAPLRSALAEAGVATE